MDRPLGPDVPGWKAAALPNKLALTGDWAALQRLDAARDSAGLWAQFAGHDWVWDYLSMVAPQSIDDFAAIMAANAGRDAQPCYLISDLAGHPMGYACYWTVVPEHGCIEIGNVNLSPALQQTPVATEAFFLMIDWAFGNGYRRVEWKCNALNGPSRRAARRLGFSYEGVFRNHMVLLGKSRDTAWFGMTDDDWITLRPAFQLWLRPDNFDAAGRQRTSLRTLTGPLLQAADPTLGD